MCRPYSGWRAELKSLPTSSAGSEGQCWPPAARPACESRLVRTSTRSQSPKSRRHPAREYARPAPKAALLSHHASYRAVDDRGPDRKGECAIRPASAERPAMPLPSLSLASSCRNPAVQPSDATWPKEHPSALVGTTVYRVLEPVDPYLSYRRKSLFSRARRETLSASRMRNGLSLASAPLDCRHPRRRPRHVRPCSFCPPAAP